MDTILSVAPSILILLFLVYLGWRSYRSQRGLQSHVIMKSWHTHTTREGRSVWERVVDDDDDVV
jgi:hypothetical protein